MLCWVMRSPLTTMGTAGGQETVGEAQTRFSEAETLTLSLSLIIASRTLITRSILLNSNAKIGFRSVFCTLSNAFCTHLKSLSFDAVLNINTAYSLSNISHSMPFLSSTYARFSDKTFDFTRSNVSLNGSFPTQTNPLFSRFILIFLTRSFTSSNRFKFFSTSAFTKSKDCKIR